tara:strand:+ start:147 stop:308 length:162 start_codon:yes stop_codon:yes gene_type:complete
MDNRRREKLMANCICANCGRYMDCTAEKQCEVCDAWDEIARERREARLKKPTG